MGIFLKENIGIIRDHKRLTYKEFAERLGCTEGQAKSYELRGSTPPLETLIELADFANITLDSLVRKRLTKEEISKADKSEEFRELSDRLASIERLLKKESVTIS